MSKGLAVVLAVLTIVFCIWGVLSVAARQQVKKRLTAIENQYNLRIKYQAISLNGFNGITIQGLTFAPAQSSLRFQARTFVIRTSGLLQPPTSKNDIKSFDIHDLDVYMVQKSSQKKNNDSKKPDYAAGVKEVFDGLSSIFPNLPPAVSIHGLRLVYQEKDGEESAYYIPSLTISDNHFVAQMQNEGRGNGQWICQGSYTPRTSKLSLRFCREKPESVVMPFLKEQYNATVKFDTLAIDIQRGGRANNNMQILRGKVGVKGLTVEHPSFNSGPVSFDKGFASFKLNVGENYIELDSSGTSVHYKRLQFSPYLLLVKNKDWKIRAALDKKYFPANDFFSSLPTGLFRNLDGIKVSGLLSYHFFLDLDMGKIDNLAFESSAQTQNFKILSFGKTDLSLMSGSFIHSTYEGGKKVREIEVGENNLNFTPINKLPRNLLQAILFAEDYSFYSHKGFYDEAFHRSLVENLKAKQFVRGASTLSMQVVKNVFLGQNKLIVRKLEEILIVWLIENNNLTSKSRMFEVYLNIIEWGPNVYGITEASRYYFIKEPSALTLSECIFLAYIIPSPKKLRSNFEGMRPKIQYYDFFDDVLKRMKRRGIISNWEAARANPKVNLRGAVVNYLSKK